MPQSNLNKVGNIEKLCAPSQREFENAVKILISSTGDNALRDGLLETPNRVYRAYKEWFCGYNQTPADILNKTFVETSGYEEAVILKNIPLVSTCEHHLAPIIGHAHVAYIPRDSVVGISKLARLVNLFARRLQLQERLTNQIADALVQELNPKGVGVIIEAQHFCMASRGVNHHNTSLVTKSWRGEYAKNMDLRAELTK